MKPFLEELQEEMREFCAKFYSGDDRIFPTLAEMGTALNFGPAEGEVRLPGGWPLDQFEEWNRRNWEGLEHGS